MEKLDYFIRRFLLVIPTFLGITLLCFALIQFVPGGPVEQIVMQMKGIGAAESGKGSGLTGSISEEQRKAIEVHFGFDKPFLQRYWKWLVTDRLGMRMESYKFPNKTAWQLIKERFKVSLMESYKFPNKTAWQLIKERFKVSLIFGITGFFLSYLVCIPRY
jgi:microcin C transport system permease protein